MQMIEWDADRKQVEARGLAFTSVEVSQAISIDRKVSLTARAVADLHAIRLSGFPAWAAWLAHQTMLINENRLSPMDPKHRAFLEAEMEKFLFGGGAEKPAGFVPE